jgi:hypothetical protein
MKTSGNEPINPFDGFIELSESHSSNGSFIGLTKREYFAAMALSSGRSAKQAANDADVLILALNNYPNTDEKTDI